MDPTSFSVPGAAPAKPSRPNVIDVTEATFAQEVVERSRQVPVVIDLWAEWCAPCRQLGPVLERLAAEGGGSWVLAKVDVDANPRIAQALQVQGIPAVKAVVGGELVDEFTGALPEAQVRQWLERLGVGGDPAAAQGDERVAAALAAERRGDLDGAYDAYRAVLADKPGDADARGGVARIDLVRRARLHDEAAVRARAEAAPDDVEAALAVADLDLVRGRVREAFARLVDLVRRTGGAERDRARTHLVGLFEALPQDDPAVVSARRDLASALF
ncbi:MAG TPA: tetratricopeptide repeat protein [Mycobacteriales bacterium]|jgi:putative thioredoxin|nr:tetratricopeptide repeat protein [Mycobacteriales bacterium]